MDSRGIWVRVLNYEKFKGRSDIKHNTWFRCSNDLLEDPDFYDFSFEEILVWLRILSLTSKKKTDTVFVNFEETLRKCRLSKKAVQSAIQKLSGKQIDIESVRNTNGSRSDYERNPNATLHYITGQDTTLQDTTGQESERDPTEIQSLVDSWNALILSLPKISSLSKKRIEKIKARLVERPELSEWYEIFKAVEASDFLSGRNGEWTACSFDWVFKNEENHVKVFEGNYKNRAIKKPMTYQERRTASNAALFAHFEGKATDETKD